MKIYTIGFTRKSAQTFFDELRRSGAKRVVDVRLNNLSQLAGFTKRDDLKFFLREVCNLDYIHLPELAPTQQMLEQYRRHKGGWTLYESQFLELMRQRAIEKIVPREIIDDGCLLCSEDKPHHCHRRLVAEYLRQHWGKTEIVHLGS